MRAQPQFTGRVEGVAGVQISALSGTLNKKTGFPGHPHRELCGVGAPAVPPLGKDPRRITVSTCRGALSDDNGIRQRGGRKRMGSKLYKYFGPELAGVALTTNGATFKCSYPKDFNDPYELFLTINFNERPAALAFYQEVIGELPQLATTCFSRSPAITPMWAHYGNNLQGFVVEVDKEALSSEFPESRIDDVEYRDDTEPGLTEMLYRAHVIGKPRYTYFLRGGVFNAAYFNKHTCWSYELETRMIPEESKVRRSGSMMLVDVPASCITAVVSGPRATEETQAALSNFAQQIGCNSYQMQIGRSTSNPYFRDAQGVSHHFDGTAICPPSHACKKCSEPTSSGETCPWCQIQEAHRERAARTNPYRILAGVGILDSYLQGMDDVTARLNERRRK